MRPKTVDQPERSKGAAPLEERRKFSRPLPEPEVVEGNGGDTDWALWSELVAREDQEDCGFADTQTMAMDPLRKPKPPGPPGRD